jgi:hypothetical protein
MAAMKPVVSRRAKVSDLPVRRAYQLTTEERAIFARLCQRKRWYNADDVWRFWWGVARSRGLDYTTIIGQSGDCMSFTALPLGHGRHWCFPSALKLPKAAEYPDNVAFA